MKLLSLLRSFFVIGASCKFICKGALIAKWPCAGHLISLGKGLCGEQWGKALSGAGFRLRSSQSLSLRQMQSRRLFKSSFFLFCAWGSVQARTCSTNPKSLRLCSAWPNEWHYSIYVGVEPINMGLLLGHCPALKVSALRLRRSNPSLGKGLCGEQ